MYELLDDKVDNDYNADNAALPGAFQCHERYQKCKSAGVHGRLRKIPERSPNDP